MTEQGKGRRFIQEVEVASNQLVSKVQQLMGDADARRVVIKDSKGKELLALPLTLGIATGVVGALVAPLVTGVAAAGGFLAKMKLEVERVDRTGSVVEGDVADAYHDAADVRFTQTASDEPIPGTAFGDKPNETTFAHTDIPGSANTTVGEGEFSDAHADDAVHGEHVAPTEDFDAQAGEFKTADDFQPEHHVDHSGADHQGDEWQQESHGEWHEDKGHDHQGGQHF